MIENHRQLDDCAHREFVVDHPGALDHATDAEYRRFGVVDDRGRAVNTETAEVVERERASGERAGGEGSVGRLHHETSNRVTELPGSHCMRAVHNRNHKSPRGLSSDPQVDGAVLQDLLARGIDRRVQQRKLSQAGNHEPSDEGGHTVTFAGHVEQSIASAKQLGGVDIQPDGRLRNLPARSRQSLRYGFAEAGDRNTDVFGCHGEGA